jgi:hypothetical protein
VHRFIAIATLAVFALAQPAAAAKSPPSHCVGVAETACAGTQGCIWRAAATRKDGKPIKAHCRKPRAKSTS